MKPVELVILMRDKTRQALLQAGQNIDSLDRDYQHLIDSIHRAEMQMERSGQSAVRTASDYDKLQSVLTKIAGTAALTKFGKDIIDVRGELEMMEKSFDVLTGSAEKSKQVLAQLKDYAVISPLTLKDISSGAQLLAGYNIEAERAVGIVKQIGDISMGDSQKFQSLLLAYAQMSSAGQVLSQDLRQMATAGFNPLVEVARTAGKTFEELTEEMRDGAVSVETIQEAFRSATAEGGRFYQMSEKQAEGLVGLKASLEDAWMNMLNDIGKEQQGIISEGYKLTTSLVQNYETVGKVLLSLVATYGTYKAAVVLATVAEKGWTVAQLAHYNVLLLVEKAQKLLNRTMLANPYVLVATAVVGLATAVWALHDSTAAEEEAQKKLNDQLQEAKKKKDDLVGNSNSLVDIINDETQTIYAQVKAWEELREAIPEAFKGMSMEEFKKFSPHEIKKRINEVAEERYNKNLEKDYASQLEVVEAIREKIRIKEAGPGSKSMMGKTQIKNLREELQAEENALEVLKKEISEIEEIKRKANKKPDFSDVKDEIEKASKAVDDLKRKLSDLRGGKIQSSNYAKDIEDTAAALDKAEKKLASLTGKDKKTVAKEESAAEKAKKQAQAQADADRKLINSESEASLERRGIALENEQKLLNIQKDGWDKRQQQIELDHKKELLAIDRHAQELIEKQQEAERLQWEKDGKKDVFTPKTKSIEGLPPELQEEINQRKKTADKVNAGANGTLLEDLKKQYQNYSDKRLEIEKKFNEDLKELQSENSTGKLDSNIAELEKQRKQKMKELGDEESAELIKVTDLFIRLFTDASTQSVNQVRHVINETQALYDYLAGTNNDDITANFGFTAEQLRSFKANAEQMKSILAGINSKKKELGDRSPVDAFVHSLNDAKSLFDKGGNDNVKLGVEEIGSATKNILPFVNQLGNDLGAIFGEDVGSLVSGATEALNSVMNVAEGFAKGGIIGGIAAVVGEAAKLFTKAAEAEKKHQEALAEVQKNRIAMQRGYNLLLLEQNLLLEEASTIFGEKQIEKAANAMAVYRGAIALFKKELQGDKPGSMFWFKGAYQKQLDAYNQGIGALDTIKIKTGHEKTGLFGWGKGRDLYRSILDVYGKDKLLNPDGSLNIDFTKTILDTQTLSDENKELLQSLIDLQEEANKAQEALRDYLQETFGVLGNDLMDSIVASIQDKGVDAWEAFGDAGAKVIENLGKQLAYELFFADKFAKLQKDLEAIYGQTGKSSQDIAGEAMQLVGDFYNNIGNDMDAAQAFMENWQKEAEKRGFDIWQPEGNSQTGKAGAFTTMTQDQGTKLEGLFTSVQNHTANIDEMVTDMASAMYSSLDCLLRIEENTSYCKRLENIAEDIAQIKRDGLKMK